MGGHGARHRSGILYAAFFLSGAAGLSFEILWTRILSISYGHTVYGLTTVLAAFMAGLALGSWLFGRMSDRTAHPVRLYALLEVAVALSCLAVPSLLSLARGAYLLAYPALGGLPAVKVFLQFSLAFVVLMIPTSFMGGTVPAASRALAGLGGPFDRRFGTLYGLNLLGGAMGAFATAYVVLPSVDLLIVNPLVAVLNLVAAGLVLLLPAVAEAGESDPSGAGSPHPPGGDGRFLGAALLLSGAAGMLYQVVWNRVLAHLIGSSTYAFSAILIGILGGLGLGSALFARLRRRASVGLFALLQAGIALGAFLLMPAFEFLPRFFIELLRLFPLAGPAIQYPQLIVSLAILIVPTTLMGMTLPCAVAILAGSDRLVGRKVGFLYTCNTIGSIGGTILTGFILLPLLGAQGSLAAGMAVNIGIATLVAVRSRQGALLRALEVGALLLLLAAGIVHSRWDRLVILSGAAVKPRPFLERPELPSRLGLPPETEVLLFREGLTSTVAVTLDRASGVKSLRINGKVDASTDPLDIQTQMRLGLLPCLMHPSPGKVGIVGLGAGGTAGVVSLFAPPGDILVLELEAAVVEAAGHFAEINFDYARDPRVRLLVEDARTHLDGSPDSFDVLISEPSNPWIAGISNLYTVEFYETVRRRLHPGGIFVQWLHGYGMHPDDFRLITRTFLHVFPEATLWTSSTADYLLMGRVEGTMGIGADTLLSNLEGSPRLRRLLPLLGADPLGTLLSGFLLNPGELAAFGGTGPLNRDFLNRLEFSAPRHLYEEGSGAAIAEGILGHASGTYPFFLQGLEEIAPGLPEAMAEHLLRERRPREAARFLRKAPRRVVPQPPRQSDPVIPPSARILEDFDRPGDGTGEGLGFLPFLGEHRPEGGAENALWSAYLELHGRVNGPTPGAGRGGTTGMVVRGLSGLVSNGFFTLIPVSPGAAYRVDYSVMSRMVDEGAFGMGVMELDRYERLSLQPTEAYLGRHLLRRGARKGSGSTGWRDESITIEPGPSTRMVCLVLFVEGLSPANSATFDDIMLTRLR